jgi:hypothetical protein
MPIKAKTHTKRFAKKIRSNISTSQQATEMPTGLNMTTRQWLSLLYVHHLEQTTLATIVAV